MILMFLMESRLTISRSCLSRTTPSVKRQGPGCLLASAGFRSREEKQLAHLAGHITGDGALLRPCKCLVDIGAFQNPETAHVLFSLRVRPIGDRHLAVGLPSQRLCVGGRGNATGEF